MLIGLGSGRIAEGDAAGLDELEAAGLVLEGPTARWKLYSSLS